ncbi:receptor-type tyrosine-protein phosphatase T-like [Dreissena polymorpha]|uniref:receptor-type tyrosine-protein phosphatase T-like n=1 Tax=Dreissena polymorpha TaxID=45954 RepID=UPI0022654B8A|nr:receptor-type tyrosine-protein phosphatase T-like [Dreissena polymorpha]
MCGYCQNKVPCNKVSGVCPAECEPGYKRTMCTDACDNGWYGQGCITQCGQCLNNATCNKTSGMCPNGCAAGYKGSLCIDVIQSELMGPAVGGSVGAFVVIAIVIVSILAIRRRRSTPTKRHLFDDIPVAFQNVTDSNIDQTPTTSKTKLQKGQHGNISNAVYANTGSPEEDGLYYNSEPLHRERKRTEIRLIAVDKLREFVRDNYLNKTIFQQEFDKIPYGLQHPTIVASAATGKNRYKEMYAYDHSRVILKRIADEPHSDYINACHVDGYMEEKKYIASQGPVNPMVGDFWRMMWEQDVCIIVMATKLVEEGKMKCLKYWGKNKPIIHGNFAVTLSEEKCSSDYTIRTITVHEKVKPHVSRNVTQFHYTAWPDKSVPTSSTSLVQFWRKIRCHKREPKQPWLIHCSAGVGRTGTFIAMDYLYDQGKETGNIDIPQCVTNLRAQRVNMVQTASQYRYLYKLILEMLVLPSEPVTTEQISGENIGLKEQFLDLSTDESLFPDDNTYTSATTNENQSKNRSMDILAADNYRPYLSSHIPNTTDYINAVIMPSFKLPTRFIITQAPLEHSFVDFCRLICEKEIELIISFDESMSEEEKCLPGENETKSISGIRLTGVSCESKDGPEFYTRSFDLNLKQKTHRFSQIVYTGWSQTMKLPQSPRSFMDLLRHVRNVRRSEAPILVQCLNGADKSGLFVVIWTLLEHVEIDGEVSIPRVVRHLRLRRKQIIPTFDQFKFCADCIALDDANTYANVQKVSS